MNDQVVEIMTLAAAVQRDRITRQALYRRLAKLGPVTVKLAAKKCGSQNVLALRVGVSPAYITQVKLKQRRISPRAFVKVATVLAGGEAI